MTLQLSYIPSKYWTNPLSGFELLNKDTKLPENADFFIFWSDQLSTETQLSKLLNFTFPEIPVQKLLTCRINLAVTPEHYKKTEEIETLSLNDKDVFYVNPHVGKIIPILPAIKILYKLKIIKESNLGEGNLSESIKTWSYLTKLIFELITRGNFIPILEQEEPKLYEGKWQLILKTASDNERFNAIINESHWLTYNLPADFIEVTSKGREKDIPFMTSGLWHPLYLYTLFLDQVGNYLIRYFLNKSEFRAFEDYYGMDKIKTPEESKPFDWDFKFLNSLVGKNSDFPISTFHDTIIPKIIRNWVNISQIFQANRQVLFNIKLNLPENSNTDWPLAFSIKLRNNNKEFGIMEAWENETYYNNYFSEIFKDREAFIEFILRAFGMISNIFPPIKKELRLRLPEKMLLSPSEVMDFLKYPKDLLIQSGFNVIVPEVFTKGGNQRLSTKLIIFSPKRKKSVKGTSDGLPSLFDINTLLQYKWQVSLEGKGLTDAQKQMIISTQEPLINVDGKWVLIEKEDFQNLNNLLTPQGSQNLGLKPDGTINFLPALKLGLSGQAELQEGENTYEVVVEGYLNDIIERLQFTEKVREITVPNSFNGTLREYQKVGLTWLANMCDLNFGVCLADDMGLGKTIQVIAYLLYRKQHFPQLAGGILIICPTSVLFNWQREMEKFGPSLKFIVHHGPNRISNLKKLNEYTLPNIIILSTYGTIRNDIELLEKINYQGVIVDESQNIKNFDAKQTKALHRLKSSYRICLSGTPIENRLLELWSLFEFLNPGLLGNRTQFLKSYVIPIERYQDKDIIDNLKEIINPFILRRVKSDKSIIKDLPEKNEIKIYIKLTDQQAILYKKEVSETLKQMELMKADKFKSAGLILRLLVKLKQICNHPYQYLKKENFEQPFEEVISYSNKLERLVEMIEEIISNEEKVIIFTQFKKMGDLLLRVLQESYAFKTLFFHGSVPEKKRKEIIDEFQSNAIDSAPILILSLKAGGTGLNLTRATTVIHFDRWWNPSVEAQATDRAYRIGQTHTVNVYKFITLGTIEEKIEILLSEKKELADAIITSSGENWITDLNIEKIKEIITLNE